MQRGTTRRRSGSEDEDGRPRQRQRQSTALHRNLSHKVDNSYLSPLQLSNTGVNMGPPILTSTSSNDAGPSNGHSTNGRSSLPPRLMYEDDQDWVQEQTVNDDGESERRASYAGSKRMPVVREEVVRLVLQGLRDMGYDHSADALESESGFILSSPPAKDFEAAVLGGRWAEALALLPELGLIEARPEFTEDSTMSPPPLPPLEQAKFLMAKQKFLEYLELGHQKKALHVLRTEIAPITKDSNILHDVSGYMMCLDKEDLYTRAEWDGAAGSSKRQLLAQLQGFILPGVMVPERRLATLLDQARQYQAIHCTYHSDFEPTSLYVDHECRPGQFPTHTSHILADHTDEVWRIEWSPDGMKLASAGKDRQVVIWQLEYQPGSSTPWNIEPVHHLQDHRDPVDVMAWSPDGRTLVTGADKGLYMWDVETGNKKAELANDMHKDQISAINWKSDGTEFIVSSMDCRLVFYTPSGTIIKHWSFSPVQIIDFVITSDNKNIVATTTSLRRAHTDNKLRPSTSARILEARGSSPGVSTTPREDPSDFKYGSMEHGLIVVRLSDKEIIQNSGDLRCEITGMKLSWDGKRVLISCNPDEVQLWAIDPYLRHIKSFRGHMQSQYLIRSCFGSIKDRFVLSGSEDGKVYVWQSSSPKAIQILAGHKQTVNCVAWNPINSRRLFASCSDDRTIRIWQAVDRSQRDGKGEVMDGLEEVKGEEENGIVL